MRVLFLALFSTISLYYLAAQSSGAAPSGEFAPVPVIIPEGSTYLSRYNLRIYENNRYQGLRYVEISGQLDRGSSAKYNASFWHVAETKHDLRAVAAPIRELQRQELSLDELTYAEKPWARYPEHLGTFPEYRNFPLLPPAVLYRLEGPGIPRLGLSYEAHAYRLTDPDGDGQFTPVQVYVRYIYQGIGEYLDETVHFFDADFALRSDGRLTGFLVQGSNKVRIAVFPGDEPRIFMNNTIIEQYGLENGRQLRLEGFGLTWIRSPQPIYDNPSFLRGLVTFSNVETDDTADPASPASNPGAETSPASRPSSNPETETGTDLAASDFRALPEDFPERISSEGGDIEIAADPLGLKLSLPNIQFEPDSTALRPGETARIRTLTDILKQASGRRFLIVGHSADIGRPQGQQELSEARAASIAAILARAGIPPGTMRYEGRGAKDPLGDNATAEGRAKNRRVEIIILN